MRVYRDYFFSKHCLRIIIGVIWFVILVACNKGYLWSLDKNVPIDGYLVDNWTVAESPQLKGTLSITQTGDGFLWIATEKSLIRYDGINFTSIPYVPGENNLELENITPEALYTDRNGTLWIGSVSGLTSYRYHNGKFKTFTAADGMTSDRIRFITEDNAGNVWLGFYSSYVNRLFDDRFVSFDKTNGLKDKKVNAIINWKNDSLLFGTRENGLFIYKDETFSSLKIPCLNKRQIIKLHVDRSGDLWIGSNDGLFRFIRSNVNEYIRYSAENELSGNFVSAIEEDEDGNLWVGTFPGGINRIQRKSDGRLFFESMFQSISVLCLFVDRENCLWIGTLDSGLFRLKDRKLFSFTPLKSYPQETIFSIYQNSNGVSWIGTSNGKVFRFESNQVLPIKLPSVLDGTNIIALNEDVNGSLWLGTNGKGVFFQKEGEWRQIHSEDGLSDDLVTSIFWDSRNVSWIGTFDGVNIQKTRDGEIVNFRNNDGLLGKIVHFVFEDQSRNIWIATDKGLTYIENGDISSAKIGHFLEDFSVTSIRQDLLSTDDNNEKVFWVATYGGGLKRLSIGKDSGKVFSFSQLEGIPTNLLSQFFEDKYGYFWIMSDIGVLRVSKNMLNTFAKNGGELVPCRIYGESEGVEAFNFIEFSRYLALETNNGDFWFANKKEILEINPSEVKINNIPPTVLIESVLREEIAVPLKRDPLENVFKGKTDWNFRFTSPSLVAPEKVRFKYRLSGLNEEWEHLPFKSDRKAMFKNLEAGEYKFEVFACNADGIWSAEPASFAFTVDLFFSETMTFKVLLGLVFMGLIGLTIYFYLLLQKKPEENRPPPYQSAQPLHPDFARECLKKLEHQMKVEKIYTDPDLNLKKLADSIKVNTHQLSRLLNDNLNSGFAEYINSHRIDEAKAILADPEKSKEKITTIALDVGFNTMPAFYNAFKKYTDQTPSAYKKAMKKKKK